MNEDIRRFAPSAARNRGPILKVLQPHLPSEGLVLEIASGSGEHAVHFAKAGPGLIFQPSDPDADARASIDAWTSEQDLENVRPAIALDAASAFWPVEHADAIICINMIHIAPWQATVGLMRGAQRVLPRGGVLFLYGPYTRDGQHTAASNETFDQWLKSKNPAWGVRDLTIVVELAKANGFAAPMIKEMPANNLSLIFRRES